MKIFLSQYRVLFYFVLSGRTSLLIGQIDGNELNYLHALEGFIVI